MSTITITVSGEDAGDVLATLRTLVGTTSAPFAPAEPFVRTADKVQAAREKLAAEQAEPEPTTEPTTEEAPASTRTRRTRRAKPEPQPEPQDEQADEDDDLLGGGGAKPTMDDAVALATKLIDQGRKEGVKAALTKAGAARVSELKTDEQLATFVEALSW